MARCLDSAADLVDEIVIVDTGSTDSTREIAARYTDKVLNFTWIDDFSAARNFSFDHATMEFCMWLDADDVLLDEDRAAFRRLREETLPQADVVMMRYHTAFDERGAPVFSYYRERVVRRSPGYRWKGAVHEAIAPSGRVIYTEAAVTHKKEKPGDPDRNLRIFESILASGRNLEPREQFYYGRELYYHRRCEEAAGVLERFLDNGWGWRENKIDACRVLADCYGALGREREAMRALLESLAFDGPRAEICCDVGGRFLERGDYRRAAWWYERALACERDDTSGAFVSPDCYGYLPAIQLCVCWYRLGDREKSEAYNELASTYKPQDAACLSNKRFFAGCAAEAEPER